MNQFVLSRTKTICSRKKIVFKFSFEKKFKISIEKKFRFSIEKKFGFVWRKLN